MNQNNASFQVVPEKNHLLLEESESREFIKNSDGAVMAICGKSELQYFWAHNIITAIRIAIREHRKTEREILKYERDSAFVTGLEEFVSALENNKPMFIQNTEGQFILKSI